MPDENTPRYTARATTEKKKRNPSEKLVDFIRDLFYASKVSLHDLFNQAKIGDHVDATGFG